MTDRDAQRIFERIERDLSEIKPGRARVVGVNGVDTSGKTEFARRLDEYLKTQGHATQLVHLDDFHNPKAIRSRGRDPIDAYITNAFDLDRLTRELLAPARRGEGIRAELDLLDLETDRYTNQRRYEIDRDMIVLLEGVLLYRPPLDRYFDYRIFLDITFDELMRRAEARNVPRFGPEFLDRYREKYIPIQKRYFSTHRPRERSDVVIDNNDFNDPMILSE